MGKRREEIPEMGGRAEGEVGNGKITGQEERLWSVWYTPSLPIKLLVKYSPSSMIWE